MRDDGGDTLGVFGLMRVGAMEAEHAPVQRGANDAGVYEEERADARR